MRQGLYSTWCGYVYLCERMVQCWGVSEKMRKTTPSHLLLPNSVMGPGESSLLHPQAFTVQHSWPKDSSFQGHPKPSHHVSIPFCSPLGGSSRVAPIKDLCIRDEWMPHV